MLLLCVHCCERVTDTILDSAHSALQAEAAQLEEVRIAFGASTFAAAVEGRWLRSDGESDPDPFKIVLAFQAKLACKVAKDRGWIEHIPDIPDCASDGAYRERLNRYFNSWD
jgi:hypothetical protein